MGAEAAASLKGVIAIAKEKSEAEAEEARWQRTRCTIEFRGARLLRRRGDEAWEEEAWEEEEEASEEAAAAEAGRGVRKR